MPSLRSMLLSTVLLITLLAGQGMADDAAAGSAAPATSAASAQAPSADDSQRAAILKDYFAAADAAARKPLAEKFAAIAPKDWAQVRRLLHQSAGFAALKPGRHTFSTEASGVVPAVSYVVRIPTGYDPNSAEGWPVVIGLHGTGGNANNYCGFMETMLGGDVEKYVVVCPDAPEGGVYRASRVLIEYPVMVLEDVRRRVNMNSDRTVLTGYSKGGYNTWATILFSPGEWGAAVPIAGWPLTDAGVSGVSLYLPNIVDLPVQAHWGENDIEAGQKEGINTFNREVASELQRLRAKEFEGIEYPGEGHGLKLKNDRIREFIAKAHRTAFPDRGRLIFHSVWEGRAWNARALGATTEDFDFTKRRVVQVSRPEDIRAAKRKMLLDAAFELNVINAPSGNTVNIMGKKISEVEIVLPAEKLDWSKPVRVLVAQRQVFSGKHDIDWVELLETAWQTRDFERLVGARLKEKMAR